MSFMIPGGGNIPKTMKAIRFNKIQDWELTEVPVPELRPGDVLVKMKSAGICGTDLHILDGDFISGMPVVPGHESSGIVVKLGEAVQGFSIGEKVTADNSELCGSCHYCRRGQLLYCEHFKAHGINLPGGFAEYCAFPQEKLFKFHNLNWVQAACFEAASCAIHGLDRIRPEVGSNILLIGAGATGLMLSQLLKGNGGAHVVMASNKGPKMELARKLDAADEYVDLDRKNPEAQWDALKTKYPYGFDVVVEASGVHKLLERGLELTTRGGKLIFYGVYENAARISIAPSKIFGDEITCTGSFSMMYCMPRAVAYLDSGKIRTEGIVTHTFKLEEFGKALDSIRDKTAVKACILFDD